MKFYSSLWFPILAFLIFVSIIAVKADGIHHAL